MMRRATLAILMTLALAVAASAQTPAALPAPVPPAGPPEFGPAHGTLMIIGGGLRSEELLKQFIALAGGPDALILFIPTAGEATSPASSGRICAISRLRALAV